MLTNIFPALQLKLSNTTAATAQVDSSGLSSKVTELDDVKSPLSQQGALDYTIARLMNLLERRPCVVESEDSKEIVDDVERLSEFVQNEAPSKKSGRFDEGKGEDVSCEVKLLTSLVVSAPSLRINQNGKSIDRALLPWLSQVAPTSSSKATISHLAIFQERKQRATYQ